jgi:hypothetical protein
MSNALKVANGGIVKILNREGATISLDDVALPIPK